MRLCAYCFSASKDGQHQLVGPIAPLQQFGDLPNQIAVVCTMHSIHPTQKIRQVPVTADGWKGAVALAHRRHASDSVLAEVPHWARGPHRCSGEGTAESHGSRGFPCDGCYPASTSA